METSSQNRSSRRDLRQPGRLLVATALAVVLAIVLFDVGHITNVAPRPIPDVEEIVTLDQNWSAESAAWFHGRSQGTMIMPYDWFLALEQPDIRIVSRPSLIADRSYLERFGFLYEDLRCKDVHTLPIGFAAADDFSDPHVSSDDPDAKHFGRVVGLTCAACHTGQIHCRRKALRIEGGPASIDLGLFQKAVGRALAFTLYIPTRFNRFAHRVLKNKYDESAADDLKRAFRDFVESKLHEKLYADQHHLYDMKAGSGRTDALALIGNRTFHDLDDPENLAVTDAPVNFPPLWDTAWFDWVQYNGSIRPPMMRNIGEALGVGALVVTSPGREAFRSTVDVTGLHEMETLLAGEKPFQGLRAPAWPADVFGAIDAGLAEKGLALYASHCKGCHPLVSDLKAEAEQANSKLWTAYDQANQPPEPRLIRLPLINIREIGTDPGQAVNMHKRVVGTPYGLYSEAEALMLVTAHIRETSYKQLGLDAAERRKYDSQRAVADVDHLWEKKSVMIADNLGYRARPLDGIWATAPYLHNGSIPNLYELLSPASQRSRHFHTGGREFDCEHVGLYADAGHGTFEFDTNIPGNFNCGHEFRNLTLEEFEQYSDRPSCNSDSQSIVERWARVLDTGATEYKSMTKDERFLRLRAKTRQVLQADSASHPRPSGLLGAEFTDDERRELIAYLKTL